MKLEDQLNEMFKEPDGKWDRRLKMARGKDAPYNWRKGDSAALRNMCKEAQCLLWKRAYEQWNIDFLTNELKTDKDIPLRREYEIVCEINQSKQRVEYITENLNKIGDIIYNNSLMSFPELLDVQVDIEGHPYIRAISFDDID